MKNRLFAYVAFLTLLSGSITASSKPSSAQSQTYYCGNDFDGTPATIVRTHRGEIPMIRWLTPYFEEGGYPPMRRCKEVSERFEEYYQQGVLSSFSTGEVNGYPVICVAASDGGPCLKQSGNRDRVLFTLRKTGENPNDTLEQLMRSGTLIGSPLDHAITSAKRYSQGRLYINIEAFLSHAPTLEDRRRLFGEE